MIVFDASTLVSTTFRRQGVPALALERAIGSDRIAISLEMLAELVEVVHRPSLQRFIDPAMRDGVLSLIVAKAAVFTPRERVSVCRDPRDNIYLELALASGAHTIISSDNDLLVLHPWRGVRILTPAAFLEAS